MPILFALLCACVSTDQKGFDNAAVGKSVPNITGVLSNGTSYSLQELDNKYLVLHLMDADCDQCMSTISELNVVMNNFRNDLDIELFSVGIGMSHSEWLAALTEEPINGKCIYLMGDKSGLTDSLNVTALPSLYLLEKDRSIKSGPFHDPNELEASLQELLN